MKFRYKVLAVTSAVLMSLSLISYGGSNNGGQKVHSNNTAVVASVKSNNLADLDYESGENSYVNVNDGQSTLNPHSWKYDHVVYSDLDNENRTSHGNIGYLDGKNVANDSLRTRQVVESTGWHQKFVNHDAIINRGHEIAYSLSKGISQGGKYDPSAESGDQNNPKNLFTQTAFSNQKVQTIYESKVRDALRDGEKVIYEVKPIFKGNDLMAKGVHMQAISTDGSLNFNVYLYNVQPGVKFNYANGRSKIDPSMQVPTPDDAPTFSNDESSYHRHYSQVTRGYGAYRLAFQRSYTRSYRRPSYENSRYQSSDDSYPSIYRARRPYQRHSYVRHYNKPAYMYKRHYRRVYYEG